MEYQLNPANPFSQNGTIKDNGDGTRSIPIIINPQIVGDTYGFVASSPSKNMTTVIFPSVGKDADEIDALVLAAAIAFCAKQYPNT